MIAKFLRGFVLAIALTAAAASSAAPRIWSLQGVTFEDGTTVIGTFVYDEVADVVTSWWIRVQGGTFMLPFTYMPGDSIFYSDHGFPADPAIGTLIFSSEEGGDGFGQRQLRITPLEVLDGTPSTVGIDLQPHAHGVGSLECFNCGGVRLIAGGSLTVVLLPPPVALVDVVEFHHAVFDHYFMSADAGEIAALDTGVFSGWARTGYSFKAYVTGSSAGGSIHPVCRYYGLPSAGLDSHFYSANTHECYEVNRLFGAAWAVESDNKFQIDLPNTTTGACPGGTVPVYRVFNNRSDANHRFTTSLAVRATMEAAGWIREGYSLEGVVMCAVSP
jgi:Repeat of unknown function (DUF5648)